jgi:3-oxoacid CoA-transferase subunit A
MITTYLTTGDLHGKLDRFFNLHNKYKPEETAIICLGDCGFNFYLNDRDKQMKEKAMELGYTFYCVRGNHEARPMSIPNMTITYDAEIEGIVYFEPNYSRIKYLVDGCEYNINGYSTLVIGGAYSVDKWYRILRNGYTEENNNPKVTGWFNDEQLTIEEMADITRNVQGKHFNLILTHTCPASIEPTDLFLSFIDQSKVDKIMEYFLERILNITSYDVWLFGHFHKDRLERPHIEQFYTDIEELDKIINRWKEYDKTKELPYWLDKSPNFLEKSYK